MTPFQVPVPATVTNATTGKPAVASGVAASLKVSLQNATGADIALTTGGEPSTFGVKLPSKLFATAQIGQMSVSTTGWRSTASPNAYTVSVVCTADQTWKDGAYVEFVIDDVTSTAPPGPGNVTIALRAIKGPNLPLSTGAPFAVLAAPTTGNLPLADVLDVSLDDQGSLYVSSPSDPLQNRLFLNFKNVGATPLSTDRIQPGNPQVLVSFVYGNTSGALAPDDSGHGTPPDGSAWNFTVGLAPSVTSWNTTNPNPVGTATGPQWTLAPSKSNAPVLGPRGSDSANVTFAFSQIKSYTPRGHTQMIVVCTGFAQSAQKAYDDHVFVLDIVKQDPPPTRGAVAFAGAGPIIDVVDPDTPFDIPLKWTMLDVAEVHLVTSKASVPLVRKTYPDRTPLAYDHHTLTISPPATSEAIFATLQSLDGKGRFLNSLQFTVYAQVAYVRDPDDQPYRIGLFGDTFWMLENYAFDPPGSSGSWLYDPGEVKTLGRLYDWPTAQAHAPSGWQLPTNADWQALFALYGGGASAYATLIHHPGATGFDARLGGQCDDAGSFSDQYHYGYYWTGGGHAAQFSGDSTTVAFTGPRPAANAISARYIRHA